MSRWNEQLENHPFRKLWNNILNASDDLVADNASITTNVEEVARFKKVVAYIDQLIENCDPELVPESTWSNFNGQCQNCWNQLSNFQSNRNISHVRNANAHLDNLLSYISPFIKDGRAAAGAATKAFKSYEKTVMQHMTQFSKFSENLLEQNKTDTANYLTEIGETKNEVLEILEKAKSLDESLSELSEVYIDGTEHEEAISVKLNRYFEQIESMHAKAKEYQDELIDSEDSIQARVRAAQETAINSVQSIEESLDEVGERIADLKSFYKEVYGYEEGDKKVEGLKSEMSKRRMELEKFEDEHQLKYKAFVDEIESLVSGATSAGLASAYQSLRRSFAKPIKIYSRLFYVALGFLFSIAVYFVWNVEPGADLVSLLKSLAIKAPLFVPILWLTVFASKRRSESLRLQQEYSHKAAIAKSYEGFKKQIKDLGANDSKLMEKLLSSAIEAISENASETLDGKHGDNSPLHELVEKVAPDLEKLNKALPKNRVG